VAKSAAPPAAAAILKGLRKALAGARRLTGDGEETLFPKGAGGKKLAQAAKDQGLLTVRMEQIGGKGKPVELGELTEIGRKHVLAEDDPKPILEALLPSVKALFRSPAPAENPVAFRQEVEKAKTDCVTAIERAKTDCAKTVEAAFARQQDAFTRALGQLEQSLTSSLAAQAPPPAVDPRPALAALEAALARVTAPPTMPTMVRSPAILEDAIVAFLANWAKAKGAGCQFDVLWDYLKERHLHLTIGTFQDTLRTLSDAGRIRLSGWPRMIDDMPQPQLALYVSSKVMYYAHPA
jgi:hypothetical protein